MYKVPGNTVFINGELRAISELSPSKYYRYRSVYEVIRIMRKCPLFFKDHIDRLISSCEKSECTGLNTETEIRSLIEKLVELTGISEGNIRISFNYCEEEKFSMIHFIEAFYPSVQTYKNGVDTVLFNGERESPAVKIYNRGLRASVSTSLDNTGAYEALLCDSEGYITEGSKSNVFFVKNSTLYTAPESRVLSGVTRKYILDIIASSQYKVEFKMVNINELSDFDAVFISGTSPMILPVRSVDSYMFKTDNEIVSDLMIKYNELVSRYLADH